MMDCRQNDIVLVDLYPKKGHEVGKVRPAVVVSSDIDNEELETIIVLPLSTDLIDDVSPYRVRLSARSGLDRESDVLVNHIRTISKKRAIKTISKITKSEYEMIKQFLCQIV